MDDRMFTAEITRVAGIARKTAESPGGTMTVAEGLLSLGRLANRAGLAMHAASLGASVYVTHHTAGETSWSEVSIHGASRETIAALLAEGAETGAAWVTLRLDGMLIIAHGEVPSE